MTKSELINELYKRGEASLQLKYEDICTMQKILVDRGYAVMVTSGDIGDDYKISWEYAGDVDNLEFADSNNVVFTCKDWLEMLIWEDYEDTTEEVMKDE